MKKIKKDSKKKEKKKSKKPEEKKEETKLEQEIKQAEKAIEIEQDSFEEPLIQIPISTETKAPVLERIIQKAEQAPIQEFTNQEQERGERRIDYSPVSNQPNYGFERHSDEEQEKKYESTFVPPVLSRREIFGNEMKQEFLRPQEEIWSNRRNEQQLEEIDIMEKETKLPFEEQKKYKRVKLR